VWGLVVWGRWGVCGGGGRGGKGGEGETKKKEKEGQPKIGYEIQKGSTEEGAWKGRKEGTGIQQVKTTVHRETTHEKNQRGGGSCVSQKMKLS